jgi:hypothetical protein
MFIALIKVYCFWPTCCRSFLPQTCLLAWQWTKICEIVWFAIYLIVVWFIICTPNHVLYNSAMRRYASWLQDISGELDQPGFRKWSKVSAPGSLFGSFVFRLDHALVAGVWSCLELEISHHMAKNLRRSVSHALSDEFVGCVTCFRWLQMNID